MDFAACSVASGIRGNRASPSRAWSGRGSSEQERGDSTAFRGIERTYGSGVLPSGAWRGCNSPEQVWKNSVDVCFGVGTCRSLPDSSRAQSKCGGPGKSRMTSLHRRARRQHEFRAHYTTSTVTASSVSCIDRIQQRPCLHHWNYPQGGYRRLYISIEPSSRGRQFEIIVKQPRLDTGSLSKRRGVLDWFIICYRYIPAAFT